MNIGIIGDGQLGRMLALAGHPLNINFGFLGSVGSPCGDLGEIFNTLEELESFADVITYESENTDVNWVKNLKTAVYPSHKSLFITQNRGREKALFEQLDIPCAPYKIINSKDDLHTAINKIGLPAILKTTTQGYDGKGQYVIHNTHQINEAWASMNGAKSILESFINFKRELSLIAVRGINNDHKYYPLVENTHHQGILRLTIAPAQNINPITQQTTQHYMQTLLDEMAHIGVLTIELFETDNGLIVNEIAPRVHNSGHWSIEGANTSQFENHIRAITDMPLGDTTPTQPYCAMINIIGELGNTDIVRNTPNTHLHLYNKSARANRKLGHINITANSQQQLDNNIKKLKNFLPKSFF